MTTDKIYDQMTGEQPFRFNEEVAKVFPDMLKRSIPGYAATIEAIGSLAARYVQPATNCYDLGCSLGAATLAMRQGIDKSGCRIVAVDAAAAMTERCKSIIAEDDRQADRKTPVDVIEDDIRKLKIENASMVVLNYTLQFLPVAERVSIISRIREGMTEGGVFVLSEKVADEDPAVEALLIDLHHEFKRSNAYTDLEISRKRTALENVLIPETIATHLERLSEAGFAHSGVWLKHFNFVSIVAIR